jgi:hypothetical protein
VTRVVFSGFERGPMAARRALAAAGASGVLFTSVSTGRCLGEQMGMHQQGSR